jgi:hypothetical protein
MYCSMWDSGLGSCDGPGFLTLRQYSKGLSSSGLFYLGGYYLSSVSLRRYSKIIAIHGILPLSFFRLSTPSTPLAGFSPPSTRNPIDELLAITYNRDIEQFVRDVLLFEETRFLTFMSQDGSRALRLSPSWVRYLTLLLRHKLFTPRSARTILTPSFIVLSKLRHHSISTVHVFSFRGSIATIVGNL